MDTRRLIATVAALVVMCGTALAQTVPTADDNDDNEPNVIGGRVDSTYLRQSPRTKKQQNLIGSPVYYDPTGARPSHHYLNAPADDYCTFFVETLMMFGPRDLALGANLTYLPERWGGYMSLLGGVNSNYFGVGPALRLSGDGGGSDFHLYGGLVFGDRHLGCEAGLRMAAPKHSSDFCWLSGSFGVGIIGGDTYVTVGLSLEIMAIGMATLLIF